MATAETSLQKFMKAYTPSKNKNTLAISKGGKQADEVNETMGSFFLINPITLMPTTLPSSTPVTALHQKKGMPDREIFVARYGKIYKRKAPSPVNSIKLNSPPGCRYCKLCDAHKPLVAFYTATQRYVCRKCHKERVAKRIKERTEADRAEKGSIQAWCVICADRYWFGYPKIKFDSTTIKDIIVQANIPWDIHPRACPIDPSIPMRPRNVAIVSKRAYVLLLEIWRHTSSRGVYIAMVQRCNLVPPRFDVAFPCDPYTDPDYVRPIIDVQPILAMEQTDVKAAVETADHMVMESLKGHDLDTPSDEYRQSYSRRTTDTACLDIVSSTPAI